MFESLSPSLNLSNFVVGMHISAKRVATNFDSPVLGSLVEDRLTELRNGFTLREHFRQRLHTWKNTSCAVFSSLFYAHFTSKQRRSSFKFFLFTIYGRKEVWEKEKERKREKKRKKEETRIRKSLFRVCKFILIFLCKILVSILRLWLNLDLRETFGSQLSLSMVGCILEEYQSKSGTKSPCTLSHYMVIC